MEIKKDHTEFPIGFLVLEEPSASSRVRSFVQKQSAPCDGDDDFQDMVLGGIPFYVGSKDSILVAVKKVRFQGCARHEVGLCKGMRGSALNGGYHGAE